MHTKVLFVIQLVSIFLINQGYSKGLFKNPKPGHGFSLEEMIYLQEPTSQDSNSTNPSEDPEYISIKVTYDYQNNTGGGLSAGIIMSGWQTKVNFKGLDAIETRNTTMAPIEFNYSQLFLNRVMLKMRAIPAYSIVEVTNDSANGVRVIDEDAFILGLGTDLNLIAYKGDFTWFMVNFSFSKYIGFQDYKLQHNPNIDLSSKIPENSLGKEFSRTSPVQFRIGISFLFGSDYSKKE